LSDLLNTCNVTIMNSQRQKPLTPWSLIILFFVISISVLAAGFLYYRFQKKTLLSEKQLELSAINDLKIRQITQWRIDRIGHGTFIGENILLIRKYSEFLNRPANNQLKDDILHSLKSLTDNFDYCNVQLLDPAGKARLVYPDQDTFADEYLEPLFPGILKNGKVVLTDLQRTGKVESVHMDLIVPLVDHGIIDTSIVGILALRIDPQKILYPLIQSWPTPSKSAETLLLRKDGDKIVYLNDLRHINNRDFSLQKPTSTPKLPAAMAVVGITGTTDGIDYRGVHVVAAMRKIPGTLWYMVAKIDRDEVLYVLNEQTRMVIVIIVLFILSLGLFLGFLWWNQRVRFYREKYEAELNHQLLVKHFDYILKFANDIILLLDKDLKIVEANDRALETYMYSRDEFIGMNVTKIRAPETLSQLPEQLSKVNENESATFETVHKRRDNTIFPIEISTRIVNMDGSRFYQSIGRDITERKSIEDILKDSEVRFRKIFEESPFPMIMTGKDFGIIRANSSFCQMIGYQEEELMTFTFRKFTHPDFISTDELSLLRLVAGEIPIYRAEKKYCRKDGSIIWGSTTVSIIRNNRGEAQFFIAMVEDITLRRKAEADLLAAKEKAEESDRLKTAFLHNVSHEIRTPMNAIIGFSTLLSDPELSESEHSQYIDIIFQSSNQLLSIINDIVDIANIESGQVKLNLKEIDLNSSLRNLNKQFIYKEKKDKIPVALSTGLEDQEAKVVTDGTKLIQILSNLISNSLKFTVDGQIDFGYIRKKDSLEFFVRDSGIGISSDNIGKIFDRFYQVHGAMSRQFGGTGLGLSICKAYVNLLGGEIWVSSQPGEGTLFRFTIPYLPA
jgi:PAS domain S-box-containing protein